VAGDGKGEPALRVFADRHPAATLKKSRASARGEQGALSVSSAITGSPVRAAAYARVAGKGRGSRLLGAAGRDVPKDYDHHRRDAEARRRRPDLVFAPPPAERIAATDASRDVGQGRRQRPAAGLGESCALRARCFKVREEAGVVEGQGDPAGENAREVGVVWRKRRPSG
jgi:hypothetical protein